MGGIVVALGDGAEQAVRRGAGPLRRRAWHTLELWSGPHAAVAFCGGSGGLIESPEAVVAIDGEIVDGDRSLSGADAAAHVLRSYLRGGVDVREVAGQFAAAVWDLVHERLVLVLDTLGTRPLYLCEREGAVLAASELKAVLAAGVEPRLDLDGAAQLLAYEHLVGASTLLEGVRLLPPASSTVVSANGIRASDRGRLRAAPAEALDVEGSVATFGRLLDAAVLRRVEPTTGLALSGGVDSRCLASIVSNRWPGSRSFTFATPGAEELGHASRAAAAAGLEHHTLELEHGYVASGAPETVWLAEGQIRCFHAHHLALRDVRARFGVTSLLVGYAGDAVVRAGPLARVLGETAGSRLGDVLHERAAVALGDGPLERVLTTRFASELRGRARESLQRALDELDGPPVVRYLDFVVREVYRRKVLPGAELFADDVLHRDPYVDKELLRFLARLPLRLRLELPVQREYLRRLPALARVPNTKEGVAPALTGWRRAAADRFVQARRGARTRLDLPLRRLGFPPRSGYSDYASHLRGEHGAKLLGLLLEDRSLDRGQVRRETVRSLVEETLSGRARHTQTLGTLLTLELFQRQFVDGDGEPSRSLASGGEDRPRETSTLPAC